MAKVMAISGTRTAVPDLCMFGLAACDEGGPGFANVSVQTITNARRVGVRLQSKCGSMHRHAQVNAANTIETREWTGSWVRQVPQPMEEHLKEDQQELETREHQRKVEDAKNMCRIVHENDKNKELSHVQNEMGRLMHHDEQELLSVWEGCHWDDNNGGWLDQELCAQARREEEYIRRHKMYKRVSRETSLRDGKGTHQDRMGREAQCAREVGREGAQDAREARVTRANAATRGAESCVVGDRHGHA